MLPEDQMRFMLSIFLSIPAGLLLRFIPSTSARKYYSILLATALQYYVYQNELFWALALHVVIYLVLKVRGRQSGFFVTVLSMVTLAVYHTYRLLTNYGSTDIELSFILMLYVSKYSLLAFAYQDGGLSEEKLKHSYQREDRVVELPSFIDFIGYLQFVPTCILNTPVDYTKYDKYIKQEGMFASIPFLDSVKKTVRDLLYGLACGGFYLVQMLYFPVNYMKDPEFFSRGVIFIVAYSFTSICLIKFKYYLAWKLSMLPIHLCGVSYQPTTNGGDQFLGVQTCNPW
jgi:lysophospholipid acyltransferase